MRRRERNHPLPDPPPYAAVDGFASDPSASGRTAAERSGEFAGYRLLRRLATGDRAQVYLAVATRPGPPVAVAGGETPATELVIVRVYERDVDQESIVRELAAMAKVGALPRALDAMTSEDGQTSVVVERLAGVSLAELLARRELSPGEAVTVLAPVAVAVGELASAGFALDRLPASEVRFDGTGRPRLVGTGALRALSEAVDPGERAATVRAMHLAFGGLVAEVAGRTRPADAFGPLQQRIREALDTRPFRPFALDVERALFAMYRPTSVEGLELDRTDSAVRPGGVPQRIDVPQTFLGSTPADAAAATGGSPERKPRRGLWVGLRMAFARGGADEVVEAIAPGRVHGIESEADRAAASKLRAVLARRRPALVVAAIIGTGALVLLLTMVPPGAGRSAAGGATGTGRVDRALTTDVPATGQPSPVADGTGEQDEPADASGSREAAPAADAAATADVAAGQLLERRAECFARLDLGCLGDVSQPGSALEAADRSAVLEARNGVEIAVPEFDVAAAVTTGEMGAAWLVSVPYRDQERRTASILVMRSEAGWRLREIFD
ncbi:hypothetical protein [Agromyces sp. LHK192]|uniref:hypothetical protein n=1 Tax=Agromyces sp. LHK192 TaxID=2498704 RepID=UPI000FDA5E87|nr:hypothetical protein [Agromyces sp. LHK192]